MRAVHLSASLGLNRLALMVGLMPPVEAPELNRILPEDIITRKVYRVDVWECGKFSAGLVEWPISENNITGDSVTSFGGQIVGKKTVSF